MQASFRLLIALLTALMVSCVAERPVILRVQDLHPSVAWIEVAGRKMVNGRSTPALERLLVPVPADRDPATDFEFAILINTTIEASEFQLYLAYFDANNCFHGNSRVLFSSSDIRQSEVSYASARISVTAATSPIGQCNESGLYLWEIRSLTSSTIPSIPGATSTDKPGRISLPICMTFDEYGGGFDGDVAVRVAGHPTEVVDSDFDFVRVRLCSSDTDPAPFPLPVGLLNVEVQRPGYPALLDRGIANIGKSNLAFERRDYDLGVSYKGTGLASADLNGDGRADLALGTADQIEVLYQTSDGTFVPQTAQSLLLTSLETTLQGADVNHDGLADLVVFERHTAAGEPPYRISVYFGQKGQPLASTPSLVLDVPDLVNTDRYLAPGVADYDGDGWSEIMYYRDHGAADQLELHVIPNLRTGTLSMANLRVLPLLSGSERKLLSQILPTVWHKVQAASAIPIILSDQRMLIFRSDKLTPPIRSLCTQLLTNATEYHLDYADSGQYLSMIAISEDLVERKRLDFRNPPASSCTVAASGDLQPQVGAMSLVPHATAVLLGDIQPSLFGPDGVAYIAWGQKVVSRSLLPPYAPIIASPILQNIRVFASTDLNRDGESDFVEISQNGPTALLTTFLNRSN
jgi:hypothetical protein